MASVSAPIYNPMMTVPASYNPPVPYQGNIPGGLGSNQTVVIKGQVPKNAHRFWINFKVGHSDIALHISPRMDENSVVRNSFLNGGWGHEERELPFNPFHRGLDFDLSIRRGKEWLEVFSKGQPFFTFMHRFRNFQRIDTLEIQGDLSIRCGNERFKVFINDQPLFNYSHRFHNFHQIDTLEIDGDVMLSYVQF